MEASLAWARGESATEMGLRGAVIGVPPAGDQRERMGAPPAEVTKRQAAAIVEAPVEKALRVVRAVVEAEAPGVLAGTAALPAWAELPAAAWVVQRRWAAQLLAKAFHNIRRTYFLPEMTYGTSDT